jgi:hypothetical protein
MIEDFRWWVWGAAMGAVALAVAFGPRVAGFAFAAVAFAFMFALMGARVARFIGDWRLDRPRFAHPRRSSRCR